MKKKGRVPEWIGHFKIEKLLWSDVFGNQKGVEGQKSIGKHNQRRCHEEERPAHERKAFLEYEIQ
jgi:hypothetical protein